MSVPAPFLVLVPLFVFPFPDPEGVVSGLATGVALELLDILEDDESDEDDELAVLLPHEAINKPIERLKILTFKIFIAMFLVLLKNNKSYALSNDN